MGGEAYWYGGSGAYWIPSAASPAISKVLVRDYTGDNTNSREIDLGDDYDYVQIVMGREGITDATPHLHHAWALGTDAWGISYQLSQQESVVGTSANSWWAGKMSGADANKIKLGANGTLNIGCNYLNRQYRILAMKFADVQP